MKTYAEIERDICISIIMPSLNAAKYIKNCLISVMGQTLNDIEILCVDAGSTDGTAEIIKECATKDDRILFLHSDIKSYGYQLNLGIRAARGMYIGIVEPDDYIDQSMYQKLFSYVGNQYPDFIKSGFCQFTDAQNRRICFEYDRSCLKGMTGKVIDFIHDRSAGLLDLNHIWSGIYKRSFLADKQIQLHESPGASYQDLSFSILTGLLAQSGIYVKESYYYYRIDNEHSSVKSADKWHCVIDEFAFVKQELIQRNMDTEYVRQLLWMKKLEVYTWNAFRLPERERERFLDKIPQEVRENTADSSFYKSLDRNKKQMYRLLTDRNVFSDHVKQKQKLRDQFVRLILLAENGDKFLLFCAGRIGEKMVLLQEILGEKYIEAVADNDIKRIGSRWNQYFILNPLEAVQKYSQHWVLIANQKHTTELQNQLEHMGADRNKILVFREMLPVEELVRLCSGKNKKVAQDRMEEII